MRIISYLTTYWNSPEDAQAKASGPFGLRAWLIRSGYYFSPVHTFLAAGTWSGPQHSPLPPSVAVVNSGVRSAKPYDPFHRQYAACAMTAACAYALNRSDWDLLVNLDNDCLVGAVDFDALLREFLNLHELLLTPDWHGRPGGPFMALKPEGAERWLHGRLRANLIEPVEGADPPLLIEDEMGLIFKGRWWNPWPQFETLRQDFGLEFVRPEREPLDAAWPFVRQPNPAIVAEFERVHTARAKPMQP